MKNAGSYPKIKLFFILCCLFSFQYIAAQDIKIKGQAVDYAGEELRFYTYSDLITYTEETLFRCTVDDKGNFEGSGKFMHEEIVMARSGIYTVYFYGIPGAEYTLYLPPKTHKTRADSLNPFFTEIPIHAGVATSAPNDINRLMMEGSEQTNGNKNYEHYLYYREGLLKFQSVRQKVKNISLNYFRDKPVLYYNEAYMDLFNYVYYRYFEFAQRYDPQLALIIDTKRGLPALKSYLLKDDVFKDDALLELVILKNLYDNFYAGIFQPEGLLALVVEVRQQTKYEQHKLIADNIINKVTLLLPGYVPPDFKLYDTEGKLYTLKDFKGKALYLMFCSVSNYGCIQNFEALFTLHNIYHDMLEIAVICMDEDMETVKKFKNNERFRWIFLHYGNEPDMLNKYDIKTLPAYFLLDKEGKIILSPAPSPAGDLEAEFIKLDDVQRR
jgi:peroxiredoxin